MPRIKMYSPSSPVLSSLDGRHSSGDAPDGCGVGGAGGAGGGRQCLRFKYFATFILSTCCLGLLSTSLATHKWIVSRPTRILKLPGHHQQTNLTSLMLTAQRDLGDHQHHQQHHQHRQHPSFASLLREVQQEGQQPATTAATFGGSPFATSPSHNNKFQGEIYFGLFKGVKVLNYGFGDRISPISVLQGYQSSGAKDNGQQQPPQSPTATPAPQQELINFKSWLVTVVGVTLALLFALISSIFAIINFVMTPASRLTGPVGLVVWNAIACFACLLAMLTWLIEYFVHLQTNVLTQEEVQNGWTSEDRTQFGYSYYLVVLAFLLHLINIFIVSMVQFESWTSNKEAKRECRSACEGVIMLY